MGGATIWFALVGLHTFICRILFTEVEMCSFCDSLHGVPPDERYYE